MAVSNVNSLYPFATYTPPSVERPPQPAETTPENETQASAPAPQPPEPVQQQPQPVQAAAQSEPSTQRPLGPGQVLDRRV